MNEDELREYRRQKMAQYRGAKRDITIPPILNPQRRAACLADPLLFLPTYLGWIFSNPFTSYQKEMVASVAEAQRYGTKKAIAAPRGDGKTKICEGMSPFGIANGYIDFIVPIAAVAKYSAKILRNIKDIFISGDFADDFPEICFPLQCLKKNGRNATGQTENGSPTNCYWSEEYLQLPTVCAETIDRLTKEVLESGFHSLDQLKIGLGCGGIIYPMSIDGAVRGLSLGEKRPNFLLIDDPETRESARSDEQIALREQILEEDAAGLKGPDSKLGQVALVTIQNRRSLAARLTDRTIKPAWGGVRRGLIECWPSKAAMDLWEEYFEIRRVGQQQGDAFAFRATQFYLDNYDAMRDGFLGTNPYRYNKEISPEGNPIEVDSLQACMNFICDNGRDAFDSEYQNDPANSSGEDKRDVLTARVIESRVNELEREQLLPNSLGATMGLDIGKYYCHWTKITWFPSNIGTVVNYGVLEVHGTSTTSTKQATERALLTALNSFYEQHSQSDIVPSFMIVDSSDGVLKDAVYNFILQCPESPIASVAAKGYGDRQAPNLTNERDDRIVGRYWYAQLQAKEGVWLYHFDGNYWKRWVQERFRIESLLESGALAPSSLSLFRASKARMHTAFANHMVAEEWREVPSSRGLVRKFVSVNVNNHWLDATAMACAAAAMNNFIDVRDFSD